jgi:hypothetical protein
MRDTSAQEPRLPASRDIERLLHMLQSTSGRFPQAQIRAKRGDIGVYFPEGDSLRIRYPSRLTQAELRDFLALFVVWLAADPEFFDANDTWLVGSSARDRGHLPQRLGRRDQLPR